MAPRGLWGHAQQEQEMTLYERMVLEERRQRARAEGRTVADIEEQANLESALALTPEAERPPDESTVEEEEETEWCRLRALLDEMGDEDDETVSASDARSTTEPQRDASELGTFHLVPEDVVVRTLAMLTPEAAVATATTCRDWARVAVGEALCEALCRRVHGRRRVNVQFRPERWRGWRGMLAKRSRCRTGGLYVLRTSKWREVKQQDMFLPADLRGTFHVEVTWWRAFRFFEDGTAAYVLVNGDDDSLTTAKTLLAKETRSRANKNKAHFGDYFLNRRDLQVTVKLPHAQMHFSFLIENGARGNFTHLDLVHHAQLDVKGRHSFDHHLPDLHRFAFHAVPAWT